MVARHSQIANDQERIQSRAKLSERTQGLGEVRAGIRHGRADSPQHRLPSQHHYRRRTAREGICRPRHRGGRVHGALPRTGASTRSENSTSASNKNTGSWNEELLKDFDMSVLLMWASGDEELQNLFDDVDVVDDDFDVEKALKETVTPKVKSGEIWEPGKHRLLVGDSTNLELVQKLMNGDLADIVWCDPPYNIGPRLLQGSR